MVRDGEGWSGIASKRRVIERVKGEGARSHYA